MPPKPGTGMALNDDDDDDRYCYATAAAHISAIVWSSLWAKS